MLLQAIGEILPNAIGVALSPLPIIAVILMLGTARGRTNGVAFVLGWIAGLVAVSLIVLVLATGADDPESSSSTTVDWVKIGFGVMLVVLAARRWRGRPRKGEDAEMPGWMETIDEFSPAKSFGLAALLAGVNPKNLALTVAAAGSIAQAGLSGSESAIAVAVFVVIASLTVAAPVVISLVASTRSASLLASMKDFMAAHSAAIVVVVLLILGADLIGSGIAAL